MEIGLKGVLVACTALKRVWAPDLWYLALACCVSYSCILMHTQGVHFNVQRRRYDCRCLSQHWSASSSPTCLSRELTLATCRV